MDDMFIALAQMVKSTALCDLFTALAALVVFMLVVVVFECIKCDVNDDDE